MNTIIDMQALEKDSLANMVYSRIAAIADDKAVIYYNFPLYKWDVCSESVEAKLLLLSPTYGLFFFDLDNRGCFDKESCERVDNLYSEIKSRLVKHPSLRASRDSLKYEIYSIIVGNYDYRQDNGYIFCRADNVRRALVENRLPNTIGEDDFKLIVGCIEGTSKMVVKKERKYTKQHTKAWILNDIQNHMANFDEKQKYSVIIDVDLPQRIRGLAGSGKTIVLAYKAALFHLKHPDKTILYTFFTKSLAETVRDLIRRVYRIYSDNEEPNLDNIHVIHGWGGNAVQGVYYNACAENGITPMNLREAKGHGCDPFAYICKELAKENLIPKYDLILIDEGQDFPVEFYRLCYKLCKSKRICWAYDDFQNIFEIDIQDEHTTFGTDSEGKPLVDLSINPVVQDIVLEKCYRTPRYVLITAFALGLGIYHDKVLQRLDSTELWNSLGFRVEEGDCQTGSHMVISRPEENTPSYSNEQFKEGIIKLKKCNSIEDECQLISREITNCINVEGLLPTDICVICLDTKNINSYFSMISQKLARNGIDIFDINHAPYGNTSFFTDGCVTLTTVNKAKGNECGVVFICGVDAIFSFPDNVVMRDKLFTSMTRTKGWLYLTGVGDGMDRLTTEYNKLKEKQYKLDFYQPEKSKTKSIENVSRQRQRLDRDLASIMDKFKQTGLSDDEIWDYLNKNFKK